MENVSTAIHIKHSPGPGLSSSNSRTLRLAFDVYGLMAFLSRRPTHRSFRFFTAALILHPSACHGLSSAVEPRKIGPSSSELVEKFRFVAWSYLPLIWMTSSAKRPRMLLISDLSILAWPIFHSSSDWNCSATLLLGRLMTLTSRLLHVLLRAWRNSRWLACLLLLWTAWWLSLKLPKTLSGSWSTLHAHRMASRIHTQEFIPRTSISATSWRNAQNWKISLSHYLQCAQTYSPTTGFYGRASAKSVPFIYVAMKKARLAMVQLPTCKTYSSEHAVWFADVATPSCQLNWRSSCSLRTSSSTRILKAFTVISLSLS